MENNKLIPFERNRYYQGKLLTSADFDSEQTYFNNKRRFINQLIFGSGIVCGLSVYTLDDMSLMIESGVGIDDFGREIVVPNSIVKKISAVDGFDKLKTQEAILCLKYKEESVQPVYSLSSNDENIHEFNRIREEGKLTIIDSDSVSKISGQYEDFLNLSNLYTDSDFCVDIKMPSFVSKGSFVKVCVIVSKLSDEDKEFSFESTLQTPSFKDESGKNYLKIDIQNLKLEKGAEEIFTYWILATDTNISNSTIIAKSSSTKIISDKEDKKQASNFIMKVNFFDDDIDRVIEKQIGKISFEGLDLFAKSDYIYLAKIKLIRSQNTYFIDSIDESIKSYVNTTSKRDLKNEIKSYFKEAHFFNKPSQNGDGNIKKLNHLKNGLTSDIEYTSGICEIPFRINASKGDIFYSNEIMHGLSSGDIFVQVGIEYLEDDVRVSKTVKNTIYGDPDLFDIDDLAVPSVKTGIKVMNEKGSFVIAAKLLRDTSQVLLTLRWIAIKVSSAGDLSVLQKMFEKSIEAVEPTITLGTRESHFINVRFKSMEACAVTYELTEKDSGTITDDGMYTAPGKEGVYEIKIYCSDLPLISTYVYVIVKKKEIDN